MQIFTTLLNFSNNIYNLVTEVFSVGLYRVIVEVLDGTGQDSPFAHNTEGGNCALLYKKKLNHLFMDGLCPKSLKLFGLY